MVVASQIPYVGEIEEGMILAEPAGIANYKIAVECQSHSIVSRARRIQSIFNAGLRKFRDDLKT
jgi:hypothetical protein